MWQLLWVALMACSVPGTRAGTDAEMRSLLDFLLTSANYSSRVRPIKDTGEVLSVTVDMYFVGINDVDEVEQKIQSTAYLTIEWTDFFMAWTPASYGGITQIFVPQENIWKPDLALSNAYDTVSGLGDKFMYVDITSSGVITWKPYQVFESTCSLDLTYFPFDKQTCALQLVTWSSTSDMINLLVGTDGMNTANYETNANWDLISVSAADASTTTTAGLSFSFKMKRKPLFYLITFIIPVILLSVLNILVFVLPADSGEKTGYAIILFLSFAIFLLIVTDTMPEGMNTVPILSIYLLLECILSTLILFLTILQLRLHHQGEDTEIPGLYRFIVRITTLLQRKICFSSSKKEKGVKQKEDHPKPAPITKGSLKNVIASNKVTPSESIVSLTNSAGQSSSSRTELIKSSNTPASNQSKTGNGKGPVVAKRPDFPQEIELRDYRASPVLLTDEELAAGKKQANGNIANGTAKGNGSVPEKRPLENGTKAKAAMFSTQVKKPMLVDLEEADENDSDDGSSEENDDVSWSDVSTALDFVFFWVFALINTVLTGVCFIVASTGGNSQ